MNDLCPCLGYSPWFSPSERNVGSFPEQQLAINTNVSRKTLQRSVLRQTVTKRIIDIKVNLKSPFIWVRLACWYSYRGNLWRNYTTFFWKHVSAVLLYIFLNSWHIFCYPDLLAIYASGKFHPDYRAGFFNPITLNMRTNFTAITYQDDRNAIF